MESELTTLAITCLSLFIIYRSCKGSFVDEFENNKVLSLVINKNRCIWSYITIVAVLAFAIGWSPDAFFAFIDSLNKSGIVPNVDTTKLKSASEDTLSVHFRFLMLALVFSNYSKNKKYKKKFEQNLFVMITDTLGGKADYFTIKQQLLSNFDSLFTNYNHEDQSVLLQQKNILLSPELTTRNNAKDLLRLLAFLSRLEKAKYFPEVLLNSCYKKLIAIGQAMNSAHESGTYNDEKIDFNIEIVAAKLNLIEGLIPVIVKRSYSLQELQHNFKVLGVCLRRGFYIREHIAWISMLTSLATSTVITFFYIFFLSTQAPLVVFNATAMISWIVQWQILVWPPVAIGVFAAQHYKSTEDKPKGTLIKYLVIASFLTCVAFFVMQNTVNASSLEFIPKINPWFSLLSLCFQITTLLTLADSSSRIIVDKINKDGKQLRNFYFYHIPVFLIISLLSYVIGSLSIGNGAYAMDLSNTSYIILYIFLNTYIITLISHHYCHEEAQYLANAVHRNDARYELDGTFIEVKVKRENESDDRWKRATLVDFCPTGCKLLIEERLNGNTLLEIKFKDTEFDGQIYLTKFRWSKKKFMQRIFATGLAFENVKKGARFDQTMKEKIKNNYVIVT